MAAFSIDKKEIINITDCRGVCINKEDVLMLRIRGEDIVCRFKGADNGYFTTETIDGEHENKYRFGSIDNCVKISGINEYSDEENGTEERGELTPAT